MKARYAQEITFEINTARIYPNEITPFAKLPNWLMRRKELTPGSKIIYCKLGQSAGKEFFACIKLETLANETGFSVAQVKRHIGELDHFGLIEVKQVGLNHANRYYFLQHPWMDEKDHSTKARSIDRVINDQPTVESSQMSHPVSSQMSFPDSSYMSRPDSSQMSYPIKRSLNKKILLKEHTQEGVCVSKNEASIYSKKEWLSYAEAQKNVYSPQALAEKLSQSRENDHLMEGFLQSKLEIEQKEKVKIEQNQQQALELEQQQQSLITEMLSLETLEPWQIQFLNAHGCSVSQQQVS